MNQEIIGKIGKVISDVINNTETEMRELGAVGVLELHSAIYRQAMAQMDPVIQMIQNESHELLREAARVIEKAPLESNASAGAKRCPDCQKIGVSPFEIKHGDNCIVMRIKQALQPDPWNSFNDRQNARIDKTKGN